MVAIATNIVAGGKVSVQLKPPNHRALHDKNSLMPMLPMRVAELGAEAHWCLFAMVFTYF